MFSTCTYLVQQAFGLSAEVSLALQQPVNALQCSAQFCLLCALLSFKLSLPGICHILAVVSTRFFSRQSNAQQLKGLVSIFQLELQLQQLLSYLSVGVTTASTG